MLEFLIPISKHHSIDRCIVSMHLPQEIINIKSLFEKLYKEKHFSDCYQKRTLLYSKIFTFRNDNNNLELNEKSNDEIVGFVFEQFNGDGELENSILLKNEHNKAVVNFETRNYSRWINFKENFLLDFENMIKQSELYLQALNLTYIDEFTWDSNSKIPITEIFEEKSEYINTKFINSKNGTIIILSQEENLNVEEKIELSFNNDFKSVQIVHQYARILLKTTESKDLISSNELNDFLEVAHLSNKDMLNSLLTRQVKDHIKLF